MKRTKLLTLLITTCLIILIATYSSAVSLTIDNKEVNPGEEFTIELKFDQNIFLGNSHITFDSEVFEFLGTEQANLSANESSAGDVAWMYTDMNENSEGIKTLTFKFKAKDDVSKKQDATFKLSDLAIVTADENYEQNTIDGAKEFKVTVNGKSGNLFLKILIVVVIIAVALLIINKLKPRKKRH